MFLAAVTLEAALVGERFFLAFMERACERSLVPILMPSKNYSVKTCAGRLKILYLSSDGCKNVFFEHCGHLHLNSRLPILVFFVVEGGSLGIYAAAYAWGRVSEFLS